MIKKVWVTFAMVLISAVSFAQTEDSKTKQLEDAAWARAGCGSDSIRYNVKMDKHRHTLAEPESGKALVYVFEDDLTRRFVPTTRVGVDGKWISGNLPLSYIFFPISPGVHRLCSNWQGTPQVGAALDFNAEAGKTYFFRAKILSFGSEAFTLDPVAEAEGHFLIASHGLSASTEKPRYEDN